MGAEGELRRDKKRRTNTQLLLCYGSKETALSTMVDGDKNRETKISGVGISLRSCSPCVFWRHGKVALGLARGADRRRNSSRVQVPATSVAQEHSRKSYTLAPA
jgi:hypothetical protein